ncbi:histidine kinase dimerization/phospho-acceptor domain-containing protein [Salidesulfovibrio onnuriiensis]|uniref:histidine kinase dimerization/phospho-acceptor domain-containing protein n=1 Tax=Salidesulfovibrio onnuriiensis TaxID=2583823 RepID=UPI0011C976A8|nr:histidine kinase dimerization/phospho-acceptor domain-containing protein [Salidesulfovibrio onnuriiensis]
MRRRDNDRKALEQRQKLMGLGNRSMSKSYYPELQKRLNELEGFRDLLNRIHDTIFIVNMENGQIMDISGAAEAMTGSPGHRLLGRRFVEILPPHIRKDVAALVGTDRTTVTLETTFNCPQCTGRVPTPVEIAIQFPTDPGGDRAVVVARDITERKQAEDEIRRYNEELETRVKQRTRELDQANEAKSDFMSFISHELRTPMTSVLGFVRIMRKKLTNSIYPSVHSDSPKVRRDMEQVVRNTDVIIAEGERLLTMVNDLLDMAKHEAGRMEYHMRVTDLNRLLDRALAAAAGLFDDTEAEFVQEIQPDLPAITADDDRLIQVILNLLSNAVKFCGEGSITFRTEVEGHT